MPAYQLDALHDSELHGTADHVLVEELRDSCGHHLATKGKKLRSSIVLEASKIGAGADPEAVRHGALAVELFHIGTLAHDDVVDDGHVRRGEPTVVAQYGPIMAGLTAGWLFGRSLELIAGCGEPAIEAFVNAACEVCEGEMQDMEDFYDVTRSEERYYDTIDKKTASLLRLPAVVGGSLGTDDGEALDALRRYGHELGLAFQISDDILDLGAPESETGKKQGIDLQQGVYTLPVIRAMERDPDLRERLSGDLDDDAIAGLVESIRAAGTLESSTEACERHVAAAKEALAPLEFADDEGKQRLLSVADYTVGRVLDVAGVAS